MTDLLKQLDSFNLNKDNWHKLNESEWERVDINNLRSASDDTIKLSDVEHDSTPLIAISYAREDNSVGVSASFNPYQSLRDSLSVLENDNKVRVFDDHAINENDWDNMIMTKFGQADLIIVLNSVHYNKKEKGYIWNKEIPLIKDKLAATELSVLRINVSDCQTTEFVKSINDHKKGYIPQDAQKRQAFFRDIIESIIFAKVFPDLST